MNNDNNMLASLTIRLSQDAKEMIQKLADKSGMTVTNFIIFKVLSPSSYLESADLNEFTLSRLRTEYDIFEIEENCKENLSGEDLDKITNAIEEIKKEIQEKYDKEDEMFQTILNENQNKTATKNDEDNKNEENKEDNDNADQTERKEEDDDDYNEYAEFYHIDPKSLPKWDDQIAKSFWGEPNEFGF